MQERLSRPTAQRQPAPAHTARPLQRAAAQPDAGRGCIGWHTGAWRAAAWRLLSAGPAGRADTGAAEARDPVVPDRDPVADGAARRLGEGEAVRLDRPRLDVPFRDVGHREIAFEQEA